VDRWSDRDEGLTLVETVVALTVFAIVSAALSAVILNTTALSRNNRSRVVAASLATGELETAREEAGRRSVVTLEQGSTSSTRTVGETTYAIRRTATWTKTTATADSCTTAAGTTDNAYLRVSVDVTWPRMNGAAPVHADTLLTPALGTYSYATGNIAVRVTDRDDRGGADHLVTVEKDGITLTQRTTAEGCAFFAFVDPGTYTVRLGTPGYVDTLGNSTPSKTTTVTAAAPTASAVSFQYDRAASVLLADDRAFPLKTDTITLANDHYPTRQLSIALSSFPAKVFPWRDGVGLWAGSCRDAQPATPPHPSLTPGASVTTVVSGAPVDVTVTRNGVGAVEVPVTATHGPDPATCPTGATLPLGTTATDGTLHVSLPYGTWQLAAGSTAKAVTLTPGAAAVPVTLVAP
jgi:type II secretory pathway pseudopilin PulG